MTVKFRERARKIRKLHRMGAISNVRYAMLDAYLHVFLDWPRRARSA